MSLCLDRWGEGGLTVIIVVADDDLLELAILAHLAPEVLVEGVKVHLQLLCVKLGLGVVGGVLVEVGEQDGLRVGGLDMLARAAVTVAACTDLVVEGAVDLVLLSAEDGGEVVRHCDGGRWVLLWICGRDRWFMGSRMSAIGDIGLYALMLLRS